MSRKTSGKFPQPQKPILSMQKCCWLHEPAKTNKGGKTHTEESQIGVTQASICVKGEEAEEWKQRRTLRYARTPTYLNILVIRKGVPALSPHNFGHTTKKNTSLIWYSVHTGHKKHFTVAQSVFLTWVSPPQEHCCPFQSCSLSCSPN